MTPALRSALSLAARGIPVFPLAGKIPTVRGGFYSASTEPDQIRVWWRRPGLSPAIATGHPLPDLATGEALGRLLVIDIDATPSDARPVAGEAALQALLPYLPPTTCVATGGGGLHLYYLMPLDSPITIGAGIRVGALTLAADWRGRLGYVTAPGAVHPRTGAVSRWLPPGSDLPEMPSAARVTGRGIVAAPEALLRLCVPRAHATPVPLPAALVDDARARAYGRRALDTVCARIRALSIGERRRAAFGPLCGVGALIAGGCIDPAEAEAALLSALADAGLTGRDAHRLIRCGMQAGARTPRSAPATR